jgi:hypothetical protein
MGIANVRNPKKSTAGSTSGASMGRNAANARGGGGLANIRNPAKDKKLGGGNPSRGGFSAKHVTTRATPPNRK